MPEEDGEPLPADEHVIRLFVPSMDSSGHGVVPEYAFALSTLERQDPSPRLSVWASSRTTDGQAWSLMGSRPEYVGVAFFTVQTVRSIQAKPPDPAVAPLDVVWHPRSPPDGMRAPDPDPGGLVTPG